MNERWKLTEAIGPGVSYGLVLSLLGLIRTLNQDRYVDFFPALVGSLVSGLLMGVILFCLAVFSRNTFHAIRGQLGTEHAARWSLFAFWFWSSAVMFVLYAVLMASIFFGVGMQGFFEGPGLSAAWIGPIVVLGIAMFVGLTTLPFVMMRNFNNRAM